MQNIFLSLILMLCLLTSCEEEPDRSDAYGNFEVTTTLVSAEAIGRLLFLKANEGQQLKANSLVALVDTTQLHLQRRQVEASIGTLPQKLKNSLSDIEVLKRRKENLVRERDRVKRLLEKKAATPKQLDDLNGEIEVIDRQVKAIQANTQTANRSILAEKAPLLAQIDVINEQIRHCYIYNPINGTVLTKLTETSEVVGMGTPLYRIAKLDTMTLRFYASAVQLQEVALGQEVQVLIDEGENSSKKLSGKVTWISEQAEFTPKTIQTKEDRVNLVYAVEAQVANPNGYLKIGMPAEVNFTNQSQKEHPPE